jgi:hypothetical protein
MPVDPSEDIAKAVCSDKFDDVTEQVSPSLFKGAGISVSRLSICPLEETWNLFRQRVAKPPARTLKRIGVLNAGRLAEMGRCFEPNPTMLTMEPMPKDGFPIYRPKYLPVDQPAKRLQPQGAPAPATAAKPAAK